MLLRGDNFTRNFFSTLRARQQQLLLQMATPRTYSQRNPAHYDNGRSDSYSKSHHTRSAVETDRLNRKHYSNRDEEDHGARRGDNIHNFRTVYASTRRPLSYQYHPVQREESIRRREPPVESISQDSVRRSRNERSVDYSASRRNPVFEDYPPRRREPSAERTSHHHSSSRQPYERRPYRPMVVLDNYFDAYRRSPISSRHFASRARSPSLRSRLTEPSKPTKEGHLRSQPRKDYHLGTFEPPRNYPIECEPPGPLPLLVLDLNGTLVCRSAGSSSKSSKHPVLRPYLKSFLQYCLAVRDASDSIEDHEDAWDEWEASRSTSAKAKQHGAHFWQGSSPPPPKKGATFRLLLWSSAQPHNVDSMARAILSPEQAEQLLRVYARDTLVTKRLYQQKAPSIKDLEILWAVLNNDDIDKEAEARLFAEARDQEDEKDQGHNGRPGASERAAQKAQKNVILPQLVEEDEYMVGKGYGQHNTLLLDDSVEKAQLQPFNHLLLPEFDRKRALNTLAAKDSYLSSDTKRNDMNFDQRKGLDDVLLQVIGVLEHARYQVNVSCWIRFGGLGNLGGMGKEHPYYTDEDESSKDLQADEETIRQAFEYFSKPLSSEADANFEPRLHTPTEERTVAFWVQEGKRALQRQGIPLQRF